MATKTIDATDDLPGAPHGAEVPYIFGQLEDRNRVGSPTVTAEDEKVVALMQAYWSNFAKNGNPNGPGLVNWPELQGSNTDWLRLNPAPTVEKNWLGDRIGVWEERYTRE